MYSVLQDGGLYSEETSLKTALDVAEVLSAGTEEDSSFTVHGVDGRMLAVFSTRKIEGEMEQKEWLSNLSLNCVDVVYFDATAEVLKLPFSEFSKLNDGTYLRNCLALRCLAYDGPFEVDLIASICEYFGVVDFASITQEAFMFAKHRYFAEEQKAPEPQNVTRTYIVKVEVSAPRELTPVEMQKAISAEIKSENDLVSVLSSEIVYTR